MLQMRTLLILHVLVILTINRSLAQRDQLEIQLKNQDSLEIRTKDQLLKLISSYDIKKWIFTRKIIIESGYHAVPHSHPVLTLNTRHLKDDDLLLSTFIHEQLHWFVSDHQSKEDVLGLLKSMYPHPRINFPDGSGGETDTYFHILICHLEYKALKELLGELRAYQIINFWQQDHYRWIYRIVLDDQRELEGLVRKYNLAP